MSPVQKIPVKPPPKRKPPPVDPTPPAPPTLGAPTGIIGGPLQIAYGRGAPWADVNRWDPAFLAAGREHHVPPQMLKAMAVIESGGHMIWNRGGSGAFGIMQIKAGIWGHRAAVAGYDLNTPRGQIGMAAAILGGDVAGVKGSTPEERFLSTYYPTAGLDVPGEDGHTPRQYLSDMHELMRQIDAAAAAITPPEPPKPTGDVVQRIMGGAPTDTSYGFKSPTDLPYYEYFNGHGGNSHQHTGIDATGQIGQPLYSPIDGEVVCAGTGVGAGAHGSSCAAFAYTLGPKTGSSGRFEIITDDSKRSLILGHVQKSLAKVGDRVKAGDKVALLGGENGPHVHIEAREWRNADYTIVDPRQAFGGGPLPEVYADRIPMPQPSDWDKGETVTVTRDGVKLLQRARQDAAEVASPFAKGDTFEAVQLAYSEDEDAWYWITPRSTRIPTSGTRSRLLGDVP